MPKWVQLGGVPHYHQIGYVISELVKRSLKRAIVRSARLQSRAGGAAFKVRGPETTFFEVADGEGQIWLFSLCGCLELSGCWSAEPFLGHCWAESCLKISSRWKVPFSCWAWMHMQDPPVEVCKSWYYTVGSCNPFILSSLSSTECLPRHPPWPI